MRPAKRDGRWRRRITLALAVVATGGAGCRLFDDPDDRLDPRGAWIGIEILQGDGVPGADGRALPPGGARISATFSPGVDERGERRRPASEELQVNDRGYPIRSLAEGHVREWVVGVAPAADPEAPLVVAPPTVIGHPVTPPPIRLTTVAKGGPDTVRVRRGETIRIPLRLPATEPVPAPAGSSWSFRLARPGESGSILQVSGWGRPPAELVVPAPYLEGVAESTLVAGLGWLQQSIGFGIDDRPDLYSVSYYATTRLEWRVEVRP